MKRRFAVRRPSPAMAVSLAALFLALGGTSYAAFSLPARSVGTKQLKKGAVTTAKIKNGAVTDSKIASGTITGDKLNLGTLGTVPSANHAGSADSATNASHASTADNATHATNADNATTAMSPGTLASGATERGVYAMAEFQAAPNDSSTEISFPFPLSSAPTPHFIPAGATPPSQCPGSVTAPRAVPGNLCIYEQTGSADHPLIVDPTTNATGAASIFGAALIQIASTASDQFSRGTWAVTAP